MDSEVERYLGSVPHNARPLLEAIRRIILEEVPDAVEGMAYRMPAYKLDGKPLVYYAAFTRHIGFYPTSEPITAFADELSAYPVSKGAVRFPLDRPLPLDLIRRMIRWRARRVRS